MISVSTKSGTNQFHGNLFEFMRNDALNANEWSRNFSTDPAVSGSPQKLRWNEFGGTFGGPIRKNKLFFFVDYQGSRFDHPPTTGQLPAPSRRRSAPAISPISGLRCTIRAPTWPCPPT